MTDERTNDAPHQGHTPARCEHGKLTEEWCSICDTLPICEKCNGPYWGETRRACSQECYHDSRGLLEAARVLREGYPRPDDSAWDLLDEELAKAEGR